MDNETIMNTKYGDLNYENQSSFGMPLALTEGQRLCLTCRGNVQYDDSEKERGIIFHANRLEYNCYI